MTEFIRVRDKNTGHEYTINAALASDDKTTFNKAYERLEVDAVDLNGNPLPPVYAPDPEPEAPAEVEVVAEPAKPGPKPTTAKPATNQEK